MVSCAKGKNNNLPIIKFNVVILAVLILFTSCVSDGKPATTSNMVVTLSPVSASATPSKSVTVTESSPVIEPLLRLI
ncbi:hypothetical protein [Acetivibrio straminisolvens]|uniref:hypothetical protein n=1 Tax=Acetivibrio straminisolvens TaxID=253314 RepID=UPI0010388EC1|nr:hypothetical protein [Acetivibrio straminisolvens]